MSDFITCNEVAEYFAVNPKTVTRWAVKGKIPCLKTPGGHRRYDRQAILKLVDELTQKVD